MSKPNRNSKERAEMLKERAIRQRIRLPYFTPKEGKKRKQKIHGPSHETKRWTTSRHPVPKIAKAKRSVVNRIKRRARRVTRAFAK